MSSAHIDLNNSMGADPQVPPKRGRGRPRKNPPPPAHPRPPDPDAPRVAGFAAGDMVWGKKLNHAAWPGLIYSIGANDQLLVSYFGDKAFAWCQAADLKPYEPYFPVAELYDDGGDDFDAALEASLDEFTRRVEATLALDHSSARRPFVPADFIALLHGLAADRMGFTNRVHAAVAKAHATAFDKFRALPDPPQYTLHIGLPAEDSSAFNTDSTPAGARSRRGRKRKEELVKEDESDEDWDPRKKGATDSDSDAMDIKASRGTSRAAGAPRGRPRGRPRKTPDVTKVKDEEETMEYPSAPEILIRLSSVAADPVNAATSDSVLMIVSFFSKYKDSGAPSVYEDKELLEMFGSKKGRKKSAGALPPAAKAEDGSDSDHLGSADGQRGRRKSAGSLYSARKAEDSYWCDIIISDFDDGDSDYEGRKRKRPSQNRSASRKMKQEEPPQAQASAGPPSDEKSGDCPAALILHFSSAEAIPCVADINTIFRAHGPILEGETEITTKSRSAKIVFSKSADAEKAYSSCGKYNVFGPSLLASEIKYLPSAPQVS